MQMLCPHTNYQQGIGRRATARLLLIWSQSAVKHRAGAKWRSEGAIYATNNNTVMLLFNVTVLESVIYTFYLLKRSAFKLGIGAFMKTHFNTGAAVMCLDGNAIIDVIALLICLHV